VGRKPSLVEGRTFFSVALVARKSRANLKQLKIVLKASSGISVDEVLNVCSVCVFSLGINKTLQDDGAGICLFVLLLVLFEAEFSRAVVVIKSPFSQQRVLGVASNV